MNAHGPAFAQYSGSLACHLKPRHAVWIDHDLDVMPGDLSAPTGFQSLQKSFLGGKPGGVRLSGGDTFGFAIFPFAGRKHAFKKPRRTRDSFADTINFDNVYSNRENHESVPSHRRGKASK